MSSWLPENPGSHEFVKGVHRTVTLDSTLSRARSVARAMGISRAANLTGLDRVGIPVVAVYRPNSRSLAVSMGKGVSLDAALASGFMEAIEDYHAETASGPLVRGSYEEMIRRYSVVNVDQLQSANNKSQNKSNVILWSMGANLFTGCPELVPYELVHTDYRIPLPEGSGIFAASSNGLASGNHPIEALIHGLCEVVERDGIIQWDEASQSEQDSRRIDLDTISSEINIALIRQFIAAGLTVGVWDTRTLVGLPSFMCWLVDQNNTSSLVCPVSGAGCHPIREIALSRALTEAAQARLCVISGARDDLTDKEFIRSDVEATNLELLDVLNNVGSSSFIEIKNWTTQDAEDELDVVLSQLYKANYKHVIAVNLMQPEFNIPVFRVVVPGLRLAQD